TQKQECGHCGNVAPMQIVQEYSQVQSYEDPQSGFSWDAGPVYELLCCPACRQITLRTCYWHQIIHDETEPKYKVLYPLTIASPHGLPPAVRRAYDAAKKVKSIDANAYGVLLGRLLEHVCQDRRASGRSLAEKLSDLRNRGEIPDKLARVAHSLRDLRNIGAHATVGELSPGEIPILDTLCRALLEYVYSAPFMVQQAERRVAALKKSPSRIKAARRKRASNETVEKVGRGSS
ncbi:MAG: DUF4145 domain-containing protein, partial [Candidatus Eisenbacteria bacterium]